MDLYESLAEISRLQKKLANKAVEHNARVTELLEANNVLVETNRELKSLIRMFGIQFRTYEKNHRAKVTMPDANIPDTMAKAEVNRHLAELAESHS